MYPRKPPSGSDRDLPRLAARHEITAAAGVQYPQCPPCQRPQLVAPLSTGNARAQAVG